MDMSDHRVTENLDLGSTPASPENAVKCEADGEEARPFMISIPVPASARPEVGPSKAVPREVRGPS